MSCIWTATNTSSSMVSPPITMKREFHHYRIPAYFYTIALYYIIKSVIEVIIGV